MMLHIDRLDTHQLEAVLPQLAQLRMQVFREFPYLYAGDLAYEKKYLRTYLQAQGSVIVIARDGDRIVGASTGIPLSEETPEVQAPFLKAGYDLENLFYCGESVLLAAYRGQGVGVAFFEQREVHARELGGFQWSCFCAVDRPVDHPSRPADYLPLDHFWQKRGYQKQPELQTQFSWKELGESTESPKSMTFWLKALKAN